MTDQLLDLVTIGGRKRPSDRKLRGEIEIAIFNLEVRISPLRVSWIKIDLDSTDGKVVAGHKMADSTGFAMSPVGTTPKEMIAVEMTGANRGCATRSLT